MNNIEVSHLHSIIKKIVEEKIVKVNKRKEVLPKEQLLIKINSLDYEHRNFRNAIVKKQDRISLIAECKKATPIKGVIRENYDVVSIVKDYYESRIVDAISVLTEERYFYGDIYHLVIARQTVPLPLLRKDFIIDEYQIYESLYYGADAVLLISSILSQEQLKQFYNIAKSLSLEIIFEVHTKDDLDKVLNCEPEIVGINNRNLTNFVVDIYTVEKLIKFIPKGITIVAESGISSYNDIKYFTELGVDAVLVGTYFMSSSDIKQAVRTLIGKQI